MKFEIDRAKWLSGQYCDGEGGYCALGAYYSACGNSDLDIIFSSVEIEDEERRLTFDGRSHIIRTNDHNLDAGDREVRLTDIFERFGVELSFTGVYNDWD